MATVILQHFLQCKQKQNIMNFAKVDFIPELLYWLALGFTGVPN